MIKDLQKLESEITKMHEPQWHNKLKELSKNHMEVQLLARKSLADFELKYIEPKKYLDEHLNVNW